MTRLAERSWTHDRTGWGEHTYWDTDGPWHKEPDKVQWLDEATRYPCLAVRAVLGAWCGYVGVADGHPMYGREPSDLPYAVRNEAHWGVNFAAPCAEDMPEGHGICHIPEPGHPDNVWWFGFDCGHAPDLHPKMARVPGFDYPHAGPFGETYRTLEYVQERCAGLAAELAKVASA